MWITTRSMEWKPLEDHSFFVCSFAVSVPEMPMRACPHKRLDKDASGKGEKKKGGKKNE